MSGRLSELIRSVRACKTQAEERETIAKECATIRTLLKTAGTLAAGRPPSDEASDRGGYQITPRGTDVLPSCCIFTCWGIRPISGKWNA